MAAKRVAVLEEPLIHATSHFFRELPRPLPEPLTNVLEYAERMLLRMVWARWGRSGVRYLLLFSRDEVAKVKGIGPKSMAMLDAFLEFYGLELATPEQRSFLRKRLWPALVGWWQSLESPNERDLSSRGFGVLCQEVVPLAAIKRPRGRKWTRVRDLLWLTERQVKRTSGIGDGAMRVLKAFLEDHGLFLYDGWPLYDN